MQAQLQHLRCCSDVEIDSATAQMQRQRPLTRAEYRLIMLQTA